MQWWCAAQTAPWTWEWAPYPGVWLFVALLGALYLRVARRWGPRPAERPPGSGRDDPGPASGASASPPPGASTGRTDGPAAAAARAPLAPLAAVPRRKVVCFAGGLVLLWAALDWPVGPLAAGYLASVHMAQLLAVSLVVPALLLLGLPGHALRAAADRPVAGRVLEVVTHPVAALALYNAVVVGTHVPAVLDTLAATQAGMLAMDLAWLAAGAVFWWPVLAPAPEREWFGPFLKMGYLFLNTIPATVPYGFLVFADFPLYATYELAPPFPGLSTVRDQRIAGLVMKIGGGVILWTAITVLFFKWWKREGDAQSPGDPGTLDVGGSESR